MMLKSRRVFLGLAVTAATAAVGLARQIDSSGNPNPAPPAPVVMNPPRFPRRDANAELRANQVEIKKDAARLRELVAELEKGLSDNDTKEVLSLDVVRKTEEIEKLAREIRGLVRG